jgi:hypothetical protein
MEAARRMNDGPAVTTTTTTIVVTTVKELVNLAAQSPATDIPTASRALGFGANLGCGLAANGRFPWRVLKLGRKLRVPTADLLASLGIAIEESPTADSAPVSPQNADRRQAGEPDVVLKNDLGNALVRAPR